MSECACQIEEVAWWKTISEGPKERSDNEGYRHGKSEENKDSENSMVEIMQISSKHCLLGADLELKEKVLSKTKNL